MNGLIDPIILPRSDGELLEEFLRTRQETCFAAIVQRHGGMVMRVCQNVLANAQDAEDAAQAVFLTLAERGSTLRGRKSLVGWLYRVAWYIAARAVETRSIRRKHEQEAARMKNEITGMENGDIPTEQLHAGMEQLPEKYLMPLLLHHVEGRSEAETASLIGCSVSAASKRLSRGRQMLRAQLLKRGVPASAVGVTAAITQQASASVSPAFVASASQMAVSVASGQVMAAGASWMTLALSKGAVHMLWMARIKMMVGAVVALAMLLTGVTTYIVAANTGGATPSNLAPQVAVAKPVTEPATQPTGWQAFKKPGIEVVDCVEVNAGPACATLALLPDGSTIQRLEGDVSAEPADIALGNLVNSAPFMSKLKTPDIMGFNLVQWQELSKMTYVPPHWRMDAPTGVAAQAAMRQMREWLKLAAGPQRDAAKAALVQAVHKATADVQDQASRMFTEQIARVREILTDEQLADVAKRNPATAPTTNKSDQWIWPNKRGDGVFEGRVLLASYQKDNRRLNVEVPYRVGLVLPLPREAGMPSGNSFCFVQSLPLDFLSGDAVLNVAVQIVPEKRVPFGRDIHGEYDGAWLLGLCMEHGWDLADFDVTDEQKAEIEEIHKKVIAIESKVLEQHHAEAENLKANYETALATLKKKLQETGADGPTRQKAFDGQQRLYREQLQILSRPNLKPSDEGIGRIKLAVQDWWESRPDPDAAGAALMQKLQDIAERTITGYIEYRSLWDQMGAVLTKEQKESMYERLYPKPKKDK